MTIRCDCKISYYDGLILLEDKNQGAMSLTNDIENIIAYLKKNILNLMDYYILAKDSEGSWEEVILYDDGKFACFHDSLVGYAEKRNEK